MGVDALTLLFWGSPNIGKGSANPPHYSLVIIWINHLIFCMGNFVMHLHPISNYIKTFFNAKVNYHECVCQISNR